MHPFGYPFRAKLQLADSLHDGSERENDYKRKELLKTGIQKRASSIHERQLQGQ